MLTLTRTESDDAYGIEFNLGESDVDSQSEAAIVMTCQWLMAPGSEALSPQCIVPYVTHQRRIPTRMDSNR